MAGIHRAEQESGNDLAYAVVFFLSLFSTLASPVLLIWYFAEIYRAYVRSQYPQAVRKKWLWISCP